MKLEIGNFHVKEIVFGEKTMFQNGILTVNRHEAMNYANPDGKLVRMELHIVHPGESVRILPAKAATEPRFRPDGRCLFPGYTGPVADCGNGIIYALKDMSVIVAGKYSSMGDGVVDMGGIGGKNCPFARLTNLVLYAERANEKELDLTLREEDEFRLAAHLLAEYLGKCLEDQHPEDWECLDFEQPVAENLPKVAAYMTIISQLGNGINDMVHGRDCHNMMPMLVHPNAILDGFLLSGMGMTGQAITTYDCQNMPIIKRLYQEHGKTLNFVGVVLVPADVAESIKKSNSIMAANMGQALGLNGAIVMEWGGGSNVDVDEFYNIVELENRGIKTVGYFCEHAGKMLVDARADAIVTTGDSSRVMELPPVDKVIGDAQSLVRDYYYGAWSTHSVYGPSLREDGSVVINTFALATGGNNTGWLPKAVKDF